MNRVKFTIANWSRNAVQNVSFFPDWLKDTVLDISFRTIVKIGYKKNSAVMACMTYLQTAIGEGEQWVYKLVDGTWVKDVDNEVNKLLRRPNPFMSEALFRAFIVTYCALGGNCYIWKERNMLGGVLHLWPLNDGQIMPVPDAMGWIEYYEYDDGSGEKTRVEVEDIIQIIWAPDPLQPTRGVGAFTAGLDAARMDNSIIDYVRSLMDNDAVPRTFINANNVKGDKDEFLKRLKAQFRHQYGGENRGAPMVAGNADITVTRIGANLEELAAESLHDIPETRIAALLRVPAILVGLNTGQKRSTYNNHAEARGEFTEDFKIPFLGTITTALTSRLLLEDFFPDATDIKIAHDLSTIRALAEDEIEVNKSLTDAVSTGGWMKISEARGRRGLPTTPADEIYLWQAQSGIIPSEQAEGAEAVIAPDSIGQIIDIIAMVAEKRIPREVGISMIEIFFGVSADKAGALMGSIGNTFFASSPPPALPAPAEEPPDEPPPSLAKSMMNDAPLSEDDMRAFIKSLTDRELRTLMDMQVNEISDRYTPKIAAELASLQSIIVERLSRENANGNGNAG